MVKRPDYCNGYGSCSRQLFSDGNGQQGMFGNGQCNGNGADCFDSFGQCYGCILQRWNRRNGHGYTCWWQRRQYIFMEHDSCADRSYGYGSFSGQLYGDGDGQQGMFDHCQRYGNGACSIDGNGIFHACVL